MKKMIELVMMLAIFASVNAIDDACKDGTKPAGEKQLVKQQGHVCYNSIAFQAEALARQGKDTEAIKMYEDAKANPDYEHHWQYIFPPLVKLYEKTKQHDKCVALWNDGHKKSMIFDIDPAKEEFKPYLKIKGFIETARKDQELKKVKAVPKLKPADCEDQVKSKVNEK